MCSYYKILFFKKNKKKLHSILNMHQHKHLAFLLDEEQHFLPVLYSNNVYK